ncbi:MAG: hypothetical protein IPM64_07615 [Phycisphaerales bacterium]|nr:hypothetical protein [Phycisphaerales bacterium]
MRLPILPLLACALAALISGCPPPPGDGNSNGTDNGNTNGSSPGSGQAPAPVAGAVTLLNEVRFNPPEGVPQFVELRAGTAGLAAGLVLVNEAGARFVLPAATPALQPGQLLLVLFDGGNRVDGATVHADVTGFLQPVSGALLLLDAAATPLDRVAWGADRMDSAPLGGGGMITENPAGALARRAHSTAPDVAQSWVLVADPQVTPGAPNPNPGVGQLFPHDGVVRQAGNVSLSWFPLSGAVKYRVQVSTTEDFAATLLDETVERPPITRSLPAGELFWRVQAIFDNDSPADFSTAAGLTLVADLAALDAEADAEASAKSRNSGQRIQTRLFVPLYAQRKDTRLLLLETDFPTGTRQAWNAPHPGTDETDPADNMNCALASISMVNGFLVGANEDRANLSQDRIGYEVFTKKILVDGGPEHDFNYGRGLYPSEILFALNFAAGASAAPFHLGAAEVLAQQRRNVYSSAFREQFWNHLVASIQNNRPVLLGHWTGPFGTYAHAVVATGHFTYRGERHVRYNDPWHGQPDRCKLSKLNIINYFILPGTGENPAADEPELRNETDDDHDRILDWDERNRFHTFADKKDSDRDCIDDFDEIELSVFDSRHGWGQRISSQVRGLIPSSDGAARRYRERGLEAPEISNDADGGGLPDYVEDLDQDGQVEPGQGESNPFDRDDDKRKITGRYKWVLDRRDPGLHSVQTREFEYDLRVVDGRITGTARATWNRAYEQLLSADPPQCPNERLLVATSDTVQTTLQVEGEFTCIPDGIGPAILLREREPAFMHNEIVTYVDPCRGTTRSLPADARPIFLRPPLDAHPDRFFPSANRRVQYKGRGPISSLPREADSYHEWDVVMEPE